MMIWPKWSRFFAKDFPGERPSIGELVCKNSPIASARQTLRNMVMFEQRGMNCEASYRPFRPFTRMVQSATFSSIFQAGTCSRHSVDWLTMRGFPLMLIDASFPIEGLVGYYVDGKSSKYFKGPRPVKAIDHTYSEMVLLGF